MLSLALNMKIPITALVNALAEFQSRHEPAEQQSRPIVATRVPDTKPSLPVHSSNMAPGSLASLTTVPGGSATAPVVPSPAGVSPSQSVTTQGHSVPKQMSTGALNAPIPTVPSLDVPQAPPVPRATRTFTWNTEIAELHHLHENNNHEDYVKRTKWSSTSSHSTKPLWHLADESCLLNFVPTPLTPPRFGRATDPSISGVSDAQASSTVAASAPAPIYAGSETTSMADAPSTSSTERSAIPSKAPPQQPPASPAAGATPPLGENDSLQSAAPRSKPPPPPPPATAPPPPPPANGEAVADNTMGEGSVQPVTETSGVASPSPPPGLQPPARGAGGSGSVGIGIPGAPHGRGGQNVAPQGQKDQKDCKQQ